jgi:hypothetical protein
MKHPFPFVAVLAAIALVLLPQSAFSEPKADSPGAGPMLSHTVFFKLAEPSDEAREELVEACDEFLAGHPGTVFYAAGVRAGELDREVNDRDFDVSLQLVFEDKAAHDAYQKHPRHARFIEAHGETWAKVRVFDSWVGEPSESQP